MFYVVAALLLSSAPAVHAQDNPTETELISRIQADAPDVLVVLGSKVVPGRNLKRRVDGAARLYVSLEGKVDFIVTGGNAMGRLHELDDTERLCAVRRAEREKDDDRLARIRRGDRLNLTEAESMCVQLVANHGVPLERIILEGKARTTVENAGYSVGILKRATYRHALILTTTENEENHAARALRNFRAARARAAAESRFRLSAVSWPYEGGPEPWLYLEPVTGRPARAATSRTAP